ncbi:hypothetical protein EPO04_04030 [Patescibacteria group bacterium]|nr:MAG: hypothetical protein EPO04_04030 [Patescibacteria group bacterium]
MINSYGVSMRTRPGVLPPEIHSFHLSEVGDQGPVWLAITQSARTSRDHQLPLLADLCHEATTADGWFDVCDTANLPDELRSENY